MIKLSINVIRYRHDKILLYYIFYHIIEIECASDKKMSYIIILKNLRQKDTILAYIIKCTTNN